MRFLLERMTIDVAENRAELGLHAGLIAADAIRSAILRRGEARVIFAAAPSQNEMLATLVAQSDIDWTRVVALHMDEYIGLPVNSKARFSYYLKKHCFEAVPFKAVYYIDEGKGLSVEEMKERYAKILKEAHIDLVCMGIGENGHVAFNDPHVADFNDPELIKEVELDDVCRQQQVNDGCFPDLASTPTRALTLTIPALALADIHVCSVPGHLKAAAVTRTLEGKISPECPATILRTFPNASLFLDRDSCSVVSCK